MKTIRGQLKKESSAERSVVGPLLMPLGLMEGKKELLFFNKSAMNMQKELLISTRGIEMPASPIRKLAPLAYAAQDRGVKTYRLNIGQPDLPTPQKALEEYKKTM